MVTEVRICRLNDDFLPWTLCLRVGGWGDLLRIDTCGGGRICSANSGRIDYTKKHRGGCTRVSLRPGHLITNRARSVRFVIKC